MREPGHCPTSDADDRRTRRAIALGFALYGLTWSVWALHIPSIAFRLHLDSVVLGLMLLNVGLGGVVGNPLAGWLVTRLGSRRVTALSLPVAIAAPLCAIFAWTAPMGFVGAFLFGALGSLANVSLNTQAAILEAASKRPVLSMFHGFFSLGSLVGTMLVSLMIGSGLADGRGALLISVPMIIVAVASGRFYVDGSKPRVAGAIHSSRRTMLPLGVLLVAALCFLVNMVAGAVGDWSSLYLATVRHLSDYVAGSGFAVFSLVTMCCRFAGRSLIARIGARNVISWGGVLIGIGVVIVVGVPWNALSPLGFALVAAGAANGFPILVSVGARIPGASFGAAVSAVATGGLLGLLIGPPVIGFVAHWAGLAAGLSVLAGVGAIVAVLAACRWPGSA